MHDFLKEQYEFSDYQIAQLKYLFKTIFAEVSKLLIMAFLFRNQLGVYFFAVTVMLLLRTSTGGLHCKTYWGCLAVSLGYMFLSIKVLPLLTVSKLFQMILLFICMLINYFIGPVTSAVHAPLSLKVSKRVRIQAFLVIFLYLTLTYILPESIYITAGFWVVILHTSQLIVAKILKQGRNKLNSANKMQEQANANTPAHQAV
jgi:accessory gene regulator B